MTMGKSMSSRLTRQMSAMPPRCSRSSSRKPSIAMPGLSFALAMSAQIPMVRRAARNSGSPALRIFRAASSTS